MIATEQGLWFAIKPTEGGLIDYEFYRFGDKIEEGVCSEAEMFRRFDALDEAAKRPIS